MTTLEVLKTAYHLLDDRSRWIQHHSAVDADGKYTPYKHNAFRYCALGAIWVASPEGKTLDVEARLQLALAIDPGISQNDLWMIERTVANANDWDDSDTAYERIREAFRTAIARLTPVEEKVEEALVEERELVSV